MEKISRIIPPNARTQSYDASRALAARPGAPKLGRPQELESVLDRVTLSEQLTNSIADNKTSEIPQQNSKLAASQYKSTDNVKSQMVREMTDRFFMKNSNPKAEVKGTDQAHSEEVVARVLEATESKVIPESSNELSL